MRRLRWWQVVLGVVLALGLVVGLGLRSLTPCWTSYRSPAVPREVCRAAAQLPAQLEADPAEVARRAEALWAQGSHEAWLPLLGAAAATRAHQPDQALGWIRRSAEVGGATARYFEEAAELAPLRAAPEFRQAVGVVASAPLPSSVGAGLEPTADAGLDPQALAALLERTRQTKSSALVLVKDGQLAGEWYFEDGPTRTELMSATKPIAGLAVGFLVGDGALQSVDLPLARVFPDWSAGLASQVTVRHVLTHTSGLDAWRNVLDFIWRHDFVQAALSAPVVTQPGAVEFYNNKAVNLIPGLVQRLAGKPLDAYLDEKLWQPLGVRDWDWLHDPAGNPHGMSGLRLHPLDLAKLGVLLADGGRWQGRALLPPGWVEQATHASVPAAPGWGYLFVLHPRVSTLTLDHAGVERLERGGASNAEARALADALEGRTLDAAVWRAQAMQVVGPERLRALREAGALPTVVRSDDVVGFSAVGSGGIHLTVFPAARLVAVRLSAGDGQDPSYEFPDFPPLVRALVPGL